MMPKVTRRTALLGLASAVSLGKASLAVAAAPTEHRFVVIILRGAMDGLSAVVPYGDPALSGLRDGLLPPSPGQEHGLLDLGGFFGLAPEFAGLHGLYQTNELLVVHAAGGPTRARSHFEAQDCLESGADHRMDSGWLNRAIAAMQGRPEALAVGVSLPLLLRGAQPVENWAPHGFATPQPDLYARIAALHRDDPLTGPAIAAGLEERRFAAGIVDREEPARNRSAFPALAQAAGKMLAADAGPRIAALELGGWDTHAAQQARLAGPMKQLDAGLVALKAALGDAWPRTAVLVMTEFGRTVRQNGTGGTDHGTGTVAFLAGGAIAGGRVMADWPGLGPGKLLEDRDLAPTTDIRAIAKTLLVQHLGVRAEALPLVFPGSERIAPATGLIRT